jgi:proline dehydrogenase
MMRTVLLALSARPAIGRAMSRLALTRGFVRRFVAGPRLDDGLAVVERVNRAGLDAALTCLGEYVHDAEAAATAASVYLDALDEIKRRGLACAPSLKLTHMGLDVSDAVCEANLRRILDKAHAQDTLVWIDMEQSTYTDRTLALWQRLRRDYPRIGCVIQAYLRRSEADIARLAEEGAIVRLCKGAYHEAPSAAFPAKPEVDASYVRLMDRLLAPPSVAAGTYPGFATHDERLQARALACGADPARWEMQMLYGIRDDLHAGIRRRGARLRLLVPFGEDWYGYFMRRLAERPANVLFLLRNVAR